MKIQCMFPRSATLDKLKASLARGKSVLLLGPRQTGKTTLITQNIKIDKAYNLFDTEVRRRFEQNPSRLAHDIQAQFADPKKTPLIFIDEVQAVPELLDVAQVLIDQQKAQFIFTGSSARKLKRGSSTNLLPGRVVELKLDPLNLTELKDQTPTIIDLVVYGSLPGILNTKNSADKEEDLISYVNIYLEEEIRAEALVRHLGHFSRFLETAAIESGNIINFSKISNDIGVAQTTIASYYQILQDCLVAERIEPFTKSATRKRLTKSPKYLFFDLGVRRVCAKEGIQLNEKSYGRLFEQFIGLELIRQTRSWRPQADVLFWRDPSGPEVDYIVRYDASLTPIEVKWTTHPSAADIKHLKLFLKEYPEAKKGYVICQTPETSQLADNIIAVHWSKLEEVLGAR